MGPLFRTWGFTRTCTLQCLNEEDYSHTSHRYQGYQSEQWVACKLSRCTILHPRRANTWKQVAFSQSSLEIHFTRFPRLNLCNSVEAASQIPLRRHPSVPTWCLLQSWATPEAEEGLLGSVEWMDEYIEACSTVRTSTNAHNISQHGVKST